MSFIKKDFRRWWYYEKDCKDFSPRWGPWSKMECSHSDSCRWRSQGYEPAYEFYISKNKYCSGCKKGTLIKAHEWAREDE